MIQIGNVIGSIGGTALIELTRVVPPAHARVLVKVESGNPTGSMKDRMALSVVDRAADVIPHSEPITTGGDLHRAFVAWSDRIASRLAALKDRTP